MKIKMNNVPFVRRYFAIAFSFSVLLLSCAEDREIKYDDGKAITEAVSNPYIQVVSSFLPFVPGTETYNIEFNVINGAKELNAVKVYKTYTDGATKISSDEILVGTYEISGPNRNVITDAFTYAELASGITPALPALDEDVAPGSGWAFRFEGVYTAGGDVSLLGAINIVRSKYAGVYTVIESRYVRGPGEDFGNWNGTEVFIGHVDDVTLSYNDRWGYFAWGGCAFNFTVDPETKEINVPVLTDCGLFSGVSAVSCAETPSSFKNLNDVLGYKVCDVSNIIVDNEETGEHLIKISYGYMGANGVPRAFTEVLKKKVD